MSSLEDRLRQQALRKIAKYGKLVLYVHVQSGVLNRETRTLEDKEQRKTVGAIIEPLDDIEVDGHKIKRRKFTLAAAALPFTPTDQDYIEVGGIKTERFKFSGNPHEHFVGELPCIYEAEGLKV